MLVSDNLEFLNSSQLGRECSNTVLSVLEAIIDGLTSYFFYLQAHFFPYGKKRIVCIGLMNISLNLTSEFIFKRKNEERELGKIKKPRKKEKHN